MTTTTTTPQEVNSHPLLIAVSNAIRESIKQCQKAGAFWDPVAANDAMRAVESGKAEDCIQQIHAAWGSIEKAIRQHLKQETA